MASSRYRYNLAGRPTSDRLKDVALITPASRILRRKFLRSSDTPPINLIDLLNFGECKRFRHQWKPLRSEF